MRKELGTLMRCPLCGSSQIVKFQYGLKQCVECYFIMNPEIFSPKSNEAYEDAFFGEEYNPDTFWVKCLEYWNNFWSGRRLLSSSLPGQRVLEVGPGSGSFLLWMRNKLFDVHGYDMSRVICDRINRSYSIKMYSDIDDIPDNYYDLIVMRHVVEHVNDPIEFLKSVRMKMVNGGLAYIAVPNIICLEAQLPGWNSYEPYHLCYFTPDTLCKAIEAVGFKLEGVATKESLASWFLAIFRSILGFCLQKNSYFKELRGVKKRPIWLETIYRMTMITVGTLTWPLRFTQARLGRGDEIVLFARK